MSLCTPLVRGPLSEWSPAFLVEGCVPGATILVSAIGPSPRPLGKAIAAGGADRVPLLPGEKLHAKDGVLVQQTLGTEASPITPHHLAVPVAPAPADHVTLSALSFRTHLHACGGAVWVAGAVPGALVAVQGPGGVLASGRASESGDARMTLAAAVTLGAGQTVTTWQDAPPGFGPLSGAPKQTSVVVDKLPVPFGAKLPTPVLTAAPLKGCDASVHIGGIVDGADVAIVRASDGSKEIATFDLDRLRFDLLAPIAASGDKLTITQSTPRCREALPSDELLVVAGPAQKPATPTLLPPCPNAVDVYAAGVEPGALVTVSFMGEEFRAMVPPSQTTFTFRIARLTAGGTVTLVQEKCGLKSDAATIRVPTGGGPFVAPDLVEPLFGCARAIRAAARPGTWLQVWGDRGTGPAPISDQVYATGSMRIYVTPYLSEKQQVWLASLECGSSAWTRAASHEVQKTPDIGAPEIIVPLIDGAMTVTVDAIPGAWVDVYSLSSAPLKVEHIGAGVVDPKGRAVPLWRPVTMKELVYVMQSLCGQTSRPSGMHRAIPAVTAFHLGIPIKRLSNQNHLKPLICLSATVVCRHSGGWEYTAELENQETEADCDFDLQFDLIGPSPAFGKPLQGQLSAAGDGSVTKIGLRIQGVPPKRSFTSTGYFAGFQDPAYWQTVYDGSHKFDLTNVAWKDYKSTPEAPDTEDPPEKGTKK